MALFSLLVAIFVERFKFLPASWQSDRVLQSYQSTFFGDKASLTPATMALALVLPAALVAVLAWIVSGMFWGLLHLALWVLVAVVCFNHQKQRELFKRYMLAACRSDVQACYLHAADLDSSESLEAVCEKDLGARVGQSVAWLNYRYYGAVALFVIFFGPVGAVFYCTVRFYAEENLRKSLNLPLINSVMFLLDWLPSRVFAFGYALTGQFSEGFSAWREHAFNPKASAKRIVADTALASQPLPEVSNAPVCVQSTLALLVLSKRNFTLMVALLSLLTIFGLVN